MRTTLVTAVAGGLVLAGAVAPAVASASPAPASCVVRLSHTAAPVTTCYRDLAGALAAATGGAVTGATATDDRASFDRRIEAADAANAPRRGNVVIGIEYADKNYGGASWIVTTTSGCNDTGGVEWEYGNLDGTGWNDRISSYHNYGKCQTNHFQNKNYGGARTGFTEGRSYIGDAMNDRTSSIQWG